MQKFVKKDAPRRYKHNQRVRSEDKPKDEQKQQDRPMVAFGEIRMINGGPTVGGYFKSLKKSQQRQVNNIHTTTLLKHKKREAIDIVFSEEDAEGVKPHDDPLVIMLMIQGFNTR